MRRFATACAILLLTASGSWGAGTFSGLPNASEPLGNLPDFVPLDQGAGCPTQTNPCTTSKAPSLRVGQPFQSTVAPTSPFKYQPWWDTTVTTVPVLKLYDGTTWISTATLNTTTHAWDPILNSPTVSGSVTLLPAAGVGANVQSQPICFDYYNATSTAKNYCIRVDNTGALTIIGSDTSPAINTNGRVEAALGFIASPVGTSGANIASRPLFFNYFNSTSAFKNYAIFVDTTGSLQIDGSDTTPVITLGGGLVIGTPMGKGKGNGTLNLAAGGIYDNGVAPSGTGAYVHGTAPYLVSPALEVPFLLTRPGGATFVDVSNPSQNIILFAGHGNGQTSGLRITPGAGALSSGDITDLILYRTLSTDAVNYGAWAIINSGSGGANLTHFRGLFGGAAVQSPLVLDETIENPPATFTTFEGLRFQSAVGSVEDDNQGSVAFGLGATVPRNQIALRIEPIGAPGTRDSHAILWQGRANDGTERSVWWRQLVDVTANVGTSSFVLQQNTGGGGWNTRLTVADTGIVTAATLNAVTAVTDNGVAPTGAAGSGYVRATSPVFTTPTLGAATATSVDSTAYSAGGTAGIANCTMVTAGATITIKAGIVTAFTGC